MKKAYVHCVLDFDVQDDADKVWLKQGFLEAMSMQGISVQMCSIEFDDDTEE